MQGHVYERKRTAGIIFGYLAVGEHGEYSDGEGAMYYFGRSKKRCMLALVADGPDAKHEKKDMIRKKIGMRGLNAPSKVLVWEQTTDLERVWDLFKIELSGWRSQREVAEGPVQGRPEITQQLYVGDNWYTVSNMSISEFGEWCTEILQKLIRT